MYFVMFIICNIGLFSTAPSIAKSIAVAFNLFDLFFFVFFWFIASFLYCILCSFCESNGCRSLWLLKAMARSKNKTCFYRLLERVIPKVRKALTIKKRNELTPKMK